MDKLKPILAHKFWMLFGLALILPVVGYFMTKGEFAAQIAKRIDTLDTLLKGIPPGTDCPNEQWTAKLNALNEAVNLANIRANNDLWLAQKERQRWPQDIAAVMKLAEYFKQVPPEQGGTDVPYKYIHDYKQEIFRLWEIVDPLDDTKGNLRDSNKRRKIAFNLNDLHQVNTSRWENIVAPTFDEIWACQEDIWLQTELLSAIARVNANSQSQTDAFIKQLGRILLFGGTRAAADSGAPKSSVPNTFNTAEDGGYDMPFAFGPAMQQRSEFGTPIGSADIPLAEEFVVAQEGGGGGGYGTSGFGSAFHVPVSTGPSIPGGEAGRGAAAKSDVKRYIDDDEARPFKQRGFYIKLVMDHRKVPELLTELMNSPFPVEIVRVHQVSYTDTGTSMRGGSVMPGLSFPGSDGYTEFEAMPEAALSDEAGYAPYESPLGTAFSPGIGTPAPPGIVRPGTNPATAPSAMADPNLASVAILGVWTIYRPPPVVDPNQAAPNATPSDTSATVAHEVAATSPAETATEPVEPTTDPSTDDGDNKPTTDSALPVEKATGEEQP